MIAAPNKLAAITRRGCMVAALVIACGCGRSTAPPGNDANASALPNPSASNVEPSPATTASGDDNAAALEQAITRGVDWLVKQQAVDGGWHSANYGQLKTGAGTTSLALYALGKLPPRCRPSEHGAIQRGFAFALQGTRAKGFVCSPDGSADYPTYATAMLLVAARRLDYPLDDPLRAALTKYLLESQLTVTQGWTSEDMHYGGWDFVGYGQQPQRQTTGTNTSIARFAVEALTTADIPASRAAQARAAKWLSRCQTPDGGFAFSPVHDDAMNKAGWSDEARTQPRAYGSATCDGLTTLLMCGAVKTDARARAAIAWLEKHATLDGVPGIPPADAGDGWHEGLQYYYDAGLAESLPYFSPQRGDDVRRQLCEQLIKLQAADGSWQNPAARMREDEPLVATAFALIALGRCAP